MKMHATVSSLTESPAPSIPAFSPISTIDRAVSAQRSMIASRRSHSHGEFSYRAYCSYIDGLLDFAQEVKRLAPVGHVERPNPEYPWITTVGNVVCPVGYGFPELKRQKITDFQALLDALFRALDNPGHN